MIAQIKIDGKRLLELSKNLDTCPLCQAHYTPELLSQQILKIVPEIIEAGTEIADLTRKRPDANDAVIMAGNAVSDLEKIRKALLWINDTHTETPIGALRMDRIVERLRAILNSLNNLKDQKKQLDDISDWAKISGLSEEEFYDIDRYMSQWESPKLRLQVDQKSSITEYEQNLLKEIKEAEKEADEINRLLSGIYLDVKKHSQCP
ncbi:hypothetical protein MKQ70_32685 [Chitinophaga sedimenti]|uniref:hypothetical protein n=1 Tax=Chitinophaga sedimenti TaxID=2033606 RepID=UPI00200444E3|nr:hypothetical protein [Chitinophaga sedimenti]MCK7559473.1 hypothetical protein [Chitinophaga sedimenti]